MIAPPGSISARGPVGLDGPRGDIVVALKRAERLTAKELAAQLGLSLTAVRHHLKELAAESLIAHDREHRGVGAPVFSYRLAPAGEALFPRRYEQALTELLDQVTERDGRAAAISMLEGRFRTLGVKLKAELVGASPAERLAKVAAALSEDGYMAESQATDCCGTLVEHNCALRAVAERYPEICNAELRFLEDVLCAKVERRSHALAGCGACSYKVRFANHVESEASTPASLPMLTYAEEGETR